MKLEDKIKLYGQIVRLIVGAGGFIAVIILRFTQDIDIYWLIIPAVFGAVKVDDLPEIIKAWRGK